MKIASAKDHILRSDPRGGSSHGVRNTGGSDLGDSVTDLQQETKAKDPSRRGGDDYAQELRNLQTELRDTKKTLFEIQSTTRNTETALQKKTEQLSILTEELSASRKWAVSLWRQDRSLPDWLAGLLEEVTVHRDAVVLGKGTESDLSIANQALQDVVQVRNHFAKWDQPSFQPPETYWQELASSILSSRKAVDLYSASDSLFDQLRLMDAKASAAKKALVTWLKEKKAVEPIVPIPNVTFFSDSLHRDLPGSELATDSPREVNLIFDCVRIGFRHKQSVPFKALVKRYIAGPNMKRSGDDLLAADDKQRDDQTATGPENPSVTSGVNPSLSGKSPQEQVPKNFETEPQTDPPEQAAEIRTGEAGEAGENNGTDGGGGSQLKPVVTGDEEVTLPEAL